MKPKILVTRLLPPTVMEYLRDRLEVLINPHDRELTRAELLGLVPGIEGLLPTLSDGIDREVMEQAGPQLRIVANYAVGFNNIDLKAATVRKIAVSNTPGVLTDTTADLTMALLLALSRRIVESDGYVRAERFKGWSPLLFLGTDVHHKTLGLLGFGRIGQAVARRARGFDLRLLYHSRRRVELAIEDRTQARFVDMETLLRASDFVSIHLPLTPETRHLIGPKELSLMKPEAFLINTARGEIIDEHALIVALKHKQIAGAGLDVYEQEPRINPALLSLANVVLLPHIGSATLETRTQMGLKAAANLAVFFNGQIPPDCLNPEIFR